eukprot:2348423-Prymnesium_polylepis.1
MANGEPISQRGWAAYYKCIYDLDFTRHTHARARNTNQVRRESHLRAQPLCGWAAPGRRGAKPVHLR